MTINHGTTTNVPAGGGAPDTTGMALRRAGEFVMRYGLGDTASGRTWAQHRSFLFNWIATRPADVP